MQGTIESVSEIKELKRGTNKKGKEWVLYGSHLLVDGKEYGLTDFSKTKLEEKTSGLKAGQVVEIKTEKQGSYENITGITIIGKMQDYKPTEKPKPKQKISDKEMEQTMKESFSTILEMLKENNLVFEGAETISAMVDTLFMSKMQEKRRA